MAIDFISQQTTYSAQDIVALCLRLRKWDAIAGADNTANIALRIPLHDQLWDIFT